MEKAENASAEALLDSLKTIDPAERRKHASVFNYWLSIRGSRQFPPIRDLDPLEISDAGPWSVLLEMIGGGEDAVVKHFGQAIRDGNEVVRIAEAAAPSLLTCIHAKLPIVAACREAYAFEDEFTTEAGTTRCWVTLLPFSASGTWIDFVYGYVSLDGAAAEAATQTDSVPEQSDEQDEVAEVERPAEPEAAEIPEKEPEPFTVPLGPLDQDFEQAQEAADPAETEEPLAAEEPEPVPEPEPEAIAAAEPEPQAELESWVEPEPEPEPQPVAEFAPEPDPDSKPSFTAKFMEGLASVGGFYGKSAQAEPEAKAEAEVEPEPSPESFVEDPAVEEPAADVIAEPAYAVEGTLHSKLTDVRALADEARQAQIRSNEALYEGLSAAYDFALDAESEPEEYLRLVEAQGLKIQLRSPMKPVVRLAFDGYCDEPTIPQLEAVLAWALKNDLPRGSLASRIRDEGGIGAILNGKAAA